MDLWRYMGAALVLGSLSGCPAQAQSNEIYLECEQDCLPPVWTHKITVSQSQTDGWDSFSIGIVVDRPFADYGVTWWLGSYEFNSMCNGIGYCTGRTWVEVVPLDTNDPLYPTELWIMSDPWVQCSNTWPEKIVEIYLYLPVGKTEIQMIPCSAWWCDDTPWTVTNSDTCECKRKLRDCKEMDWGGPMQAAPLERL